MLRIYDLRAVSLSAFLIRENVSGRERATM